MMAPPLMLVSARADARLRSEVAAGRRPRPEYLELERRGVKLLDWSQLWGNPTRRSPASAGAHVAGALHRLSSAGAVFSDGEHVGLPLALAMRTFGLRRPHLMLAHHLTNRGKAALLRRLRADRAIDRVIVHSPRQLELIHRFGVAADKLALEPYCVDTQFWSPVQIDEENLVLAAGLDHRDYITLVEACRGLEAQVVIAAGSAHSPHATARLPRVWPPGFEVRPVDPLRLRDLYARASVVVVPVVETDFQAGVTVVLEGMAMGRPVVASAASGWSGVIQDGRDGLLVRPGDPRGLRLAVLRLLDDSSLRSRLGRRARQTALERHQLEAYCSRLLQHLEEISRQARSAGVEQRASSKIAPKVPPGTEASASEGWVGERRKPRRQESCV